jgi:hypothetical protein
MAKQALGRRNTALVQGTELDLGLPGPFCPTNFGLDRFEPLVIVPTQRIPAGQMLPTSNIRVTEPKDTLLAMPQPHQERGVQDHLALTA